MTMPKRIPTLAGVLAGALFLAPGGLWAQPPPPARHGPGSAS